MKELLQKAAEPSSILPAFTRSVCRRVTLVVVAVAALLDAMVMLPVYVAERNAFVEDHAAEAASLLAAAADPTRYPSIETLVEFGNNLVRGTDVAGGLIISGAGEDRAVFGAVPGLTWAEARLGGETARLDGGAGHFDVFIAPEQSQLPYGVILRLDVKADWDRLTARLRDLALLLLTASAVLGAATMVLVANQVGRPLDAIRKAVDFTLDAPEEAGGIHTGVSRNDEIGALARAVDQLLFLTSTTFTDDLAAAVTILETLPHGVLTFSEQGHLVSANRSALSLFGERSFAGLLHRDPTSLFRFADQTVSCIELAGRGRVLGPGEVLREGEDFPCLVAGDMVRRADGSVLRRYLVFVDMRDLVQQVRSEVHRRETAERQIRKMAGDMRLMRRMFDACLVVADLDGSAEGRSNAVTMQPRDLIDAWAARLAAEGDPAPGSLEIGDLPPVVGEPSELRRLFDIALEVVRLRSGSARPRMSVAGLVKEDTVTFLVRERDGGGGEMAIASDVDVAILLGAIGVLCRRQDGSLLATSGGEDANRLAFRLKIDLRMMDTEPADSEAA